MSEIQLVDPETIPVLPGPPISLGCPKGKKARKAAKAKTDLSGAKVPKKRAPTRVDPKYEELKARINHIANDLEFLVSNIVKQLNDVGR